MAIPRRFPGYLGNHDVSPAARGEVVRQQALPGPQLSAGQAAGRPSSGTVRVFFARRIDARSAGLARASATICAMAPLEIRVRLRAIVGRVYLSG